MAMSKEEMCVLLKATGQQHNIMVSIILTSVFMFYIVSNPHFEHKKILPLLVGNNVATTTTTIMGN